MKISAIPLNLPFLDIVADQWFSQAYVQQLDLQKGQIILPNRRSVKALTEAFLRKTKGKALLLPRIVSVGDMDEVGLVLNGRYIFDLFPAVDPVQRIAILTHLVMAMQHHLKRREHADEAWQLAQALADLLDEAEWVDCDLKERLPDAVGPDYAVHWNQILEFLSIITEAWPAWLLENQRMDPVARRVALLRAQIQYWEKEPPKEPVWAVGFIDTRPVMLELFAAILNLPQGQMIFSEVQTDLTEEIWNHLPPTHPYAEMAQMLQVLNIQRSDLHNWTKYSSNRQIPRKRVWAIQQALLPAQSLDQWLPNHINVQLGQCSLLEALDHQEEASAIALIIREALETPHKQIAFVTPDRNLAVQVALELGRWGVVADDSAGEPLSKTPAAVLLCLIIKAMTEQFSPVSLLALLKHPLVSCGLTRGECRASARTLERIALRGGGTSPPGFLGLRQMLSYAQQKQGKEQFEAIDTAMSESPGEFLDRLEGIFSPLLQQNQPCSLPQWLNLWIRVAEALVASPEAGGEKSLWGGEEGNALAEHLVAMISGTEILSQISLEALESLLKSSFKGVVVHGRRALRGKAVQALHPRVYIWGLLEARLQSVDVMILGGLSEGVWPAVAESGPWINRPMRSCMGLPSPDVKIGRNAYDFMQLCCSTPEVVLASPLRRDGAPVVQSRWIVRLKAWLAGHRMVLTKHPALHWVAKLDKPVHAVRPISSPKPRPPLHWRPRSMSVSEVTTWLKDPYTIYAKKILRLKKIPLLEEDFQGLDFANLIRNGLNHAYLKPDLLGSEKGKLFLRHCLINALEERQDIAPVFRAWWHPNLLKIADWVFENEQKRQNLINSVKMKIQSEGQYYFADIPGGGFYLRCRTDRLELGSDGKLTIFNYKKNDAFKLSPEIKDEEIRKLLLASAIAAKGGFGKNFQTENTEMIYWKLSGREEGCQEYHVGKSGNKKFTSEELGKINKELVQEYQQKLEAFILAYFDEKQPYFSSPRSFKKDSFADYDQLARIQEWSILRGDE